MTTTQSLPPQAVLLQMLFGYAPARAISIAAELRIADLLTNGSKTAEELALKTNSHARSLYRLLRACASVGVFWEDTEKRFSLTPMADFLRSDNPESLRAFAEMLAHGEQFQTWSALDFSVQTGTPAFDKVHGMPIFEYYPTHPKSGQIFNDAMTSMSLGSSMAVMQAYDFSGITKLVDIGGGHGFLLASILEKYLNMTGILFDTPPIVEEAKGLLEKHGVSNRCETAGGNFFESVPNGGDAYMMKHIIHDWNDEECVTILKNCRKGIVDGGKLLVIEMVVPKGNEPSLSKLLDLQMLAVLPGCERTEDEYSTLFSKASFKLTNIIPTMSPYSVIEGVAI
ncbi:MAG: methyltransferase [Microscillaceae bacterium]|nr:methyltransferase [Microscillaceae bacterium]